MRTILLLTCVLLISCSTYTETYEIVYFNGEKEIVQFINNGSYEISLSEGCVHSLKRCGVRTYKLINREKCE